MDPATPHSLTELDSIIYNELLGIAGKFISRSLAKGHTRKSLVHESYARLLDSSKGNPNIKNEQHLKRLMARAMRFVCADWDREAKALKRGGGKEPLPFDSKEFQDSMVHHDFVSDYTVMYEALGSFAVIHPDLAELIEGWLLWGCSPKELAEMYAIPRADARAALVMFLRHYRKGDPHE